MQIQLYYLLISVLLIQMSSGCKKESKEGHPPSPPDQELDKRNIIIDKSVKYQTIDGFGFFGAYDVWWASQNLWNFCNSF